MLRKSSWKTWVILGVAVAIMTASGSMMMASNMGFKINKQMWAKEVAAQSPKRDNWISLPYNNPYPNPKALCSTLGYSGLQQSIRKLNPATGTFADGSGDTGFNFTCNGAGPGCSAGQTCNPMPTNVGLLVRNTLTTVGDFTGSVLVGSSNETQPLPKIYGGFVASGAPKKDNWISVPYHTTWVRASDICATVGLTTLLSGSIVRVNGDPAASTAVTTCNCSTTVCSGTNNFSLVMGEAVIVRKNTAGDLAGPIFPPHF
jgi:hypothetical protein